MGILDSVLTETGSQLGISTRSAGSVLSGLLAFINQEDGGVAAFLDRFRRAGGSNLVSSWLVGDARVVSAGAVENAMGHQTIDRIGARAGLSFSTASSAIALMLPKLVQRLAPGGVVPKSLSPDVLSYVTAAIPSATAASVDAAGARAAANLGARRFAWPLLAMLLAAGLFLWWFALRGPVSQGVFNIDEQVRVASQKASAALAALRPGYTARDLTNALNLHVINFASGSAQIPADSYEFLRKAAQAMQNAPAGTVVEIGGHTDATGVAASNVQLSQRRAAAVRDYLVQQGVNPAALTSVGYGDARPVDTNATEGGRFNNRRIEFLPR